MKDQIQQILDSGLSLSVVDGRLKVVGTPKTVDALRPLLQQYRSEIIRKLQAAGAIQDSSAMPEHDNDKDSSAHTAPAQQPENDAERLAAWERGELVTIPHTAEALEIYRALELEHTAKQIGKPEFAEELSRALATIDQINEQQRPEDFDFALSVLRSVTEDAAALLSARAKRAAA